jgi:hypothetical protein
MKFSRDETAPLELIERWMGESYRLQADPRLVAELDEL